MPPIIRCTSLSLLLAAALLIGCKATPAPSAGFADPTVLKNDPNIPFNRFWRDPGLDLNQYDKIYVAEVNTSYMLKMTKWQEGDRKADIEKDVQTIADFTRASIIKAYRDDPSHHFQVLDSPGHEPHTLIFEVAIVQIVPSKVLLNLLGYAPFYVGTGISLARDAANDKSSIAFESRTSDAYSGRIVMQAADRESEQYAIVDFRGLTWYGDVEGIIKDWSKQFVEVTNAKPGQKVAGYSTFRLLPW